MFSTIPAGRALPEALWKARLGKKLGGHDTGIDENLPLRKGRTMTRPDNKGRQFKQAIYDVIFGFESTAGKLFDLILICVILASVIAVLVDSVAQYHVRFGPLLYRLEWFFTFAFTIEYALRIYSYPSARKYVFSFYGLIDLASILPTYIAFLYPTAAYVIVIRILRVLRIFRILKLFRYIGEANLLFAALHN